MIWDPYWLTNPWHVALTPLGKKLQKSFMIKSSMLSWWIVAYCSTVVRRRVQTKHWKLGPKSPTLVGFKRALSQNCLELGVWLLCLILGVPRRVNEEIGMEKVAIRRMRIQR